MTEQREPYDFQKPSEHQPQPDSWQARRQEATRVVEAPESDLGRELWWRRMTQGGTTDL